jgi:hypothetical protein
MMHGAPAPCRGNPGNMEPLMEKLRLDLDTLTVESFESTSEDGRRGTIAAHDGSCSVGFTCGVMSRGAEGFEMYANTRYSCCV